MLYKYPKTPHLPFSDGISISDKILDTTDIFSDKEIVITEKMDGENTSIYKNYYHARSLNSRHMSYHSYLLSVIIPKIQLQIPEGWRICGEYMYAKHSIFYNNLPDYFLCFSVWNDNNICLSWKDTKDFCLKLDIQLVPELYHGVYDEKIVKSIATDVVAHGGEGIVVRNADSFAYNEFSDNVAKYVRSNHVQTDNHWMFEKIEKNILQNK